MVEYVSSSKPDMAIFQEHDAKDHKKTFFIKKT